MSTIDLTGGVQQEKSYEGLERVALKDVEYIPFNRYRDLTIGERDKRRKWSKQRVEAASNVAWGQLKLLMTEIQFLTLYWDPEQVRRPHIVYVGSAPGTHIETLYKMFPMATFDLYDGRDHDPILNKIKAIKTHKTLFTDEHAKSYTGRKDVFFISDIRTLIYKRDEKLTDEEMKENERLVEEDMKRQMEWVKIIRPVKASLKFRLPYSYDFILERGKVTPYLDGLVHRQAWTPGTSTETRIVPFDNLRMRDWDYVAHEEMMFYHNTVTRATQKYKNPILQDKTPIAPELGLLNDYDSVLMTNTVMEYLRKFNIPTDEHNVVSLLKAIIKGVDPQCRHDGILTRRN